MRGFLPVGPELRACVAHFVRALIQWEGGAPGPLAPGRRRAAGAVGTRRMRHPWVSPTCLACPIARYESPFTGTDWEGVGVRPDIEVPEEEAIEAALAAARRPVAEP